MKMKKWLQKTFMIQLLIVLSVWIVNAQEISLSGKVSSKDGNSIPGVTVVVKSTSIGTITDSDGRFSLKLPAKSKTLVFSFVGMKSQEVPIAASTSYNVVLEEDTYNLDEVVAVGYGTMKKSDLTGAVSSLKSDAIHASPVANISQSLQGRIAGVQVTQNSGVPGASLQIRIRGTNSIKGDNSPLWIIDGFPGDQSMINVSDIESLNVLKDASATAIYGSRGANGVIIVTTKHGKSGTTRVDYEGSLSMQNLIKKMPLMDAQEYMKFYNIEQLNDAGSEYFTQAQISGAGKGIDWQDLMFRAAPINDHSLSVSGGNEKTQFSVGGSYLGQEGILLNNRGYQRISLRASINHDISKKFSISYNAILTRSDNDNKSSSGQFGMFSTTMIAPPTFSPYNEDGSYANSLTQYPFSYGSQCNMVMWANEVSDKTKANKVMANLAFTIKPIKDLSIKISGNVLNSDSRNDYYQTTKYISSSGSASISAAQSLSLNSDNIITYHKKFGDNHDFSATGAVTYEQNEYTTLGASGSGFLSDVYETYNIGSASTIGTPSSSYAKWSLLSYLGRLNYSYKDKYLATVSFRSDGSSRYSEGNKWGYFPSGALAWRISEEDFLKDVAFISNLKLRGGYGETGSTAINPYSTLSMLSAGKVPFNKTSYTYFAPPTTYPGALKWETTAQTDIGIDVGLFENRLNLTADYYIKNTRDLLNNVQMPRSSGYTSTIKNIGKMQNKGFELQIDAKVLDKTLKWDVSANVSINRNKVTKLYEGQDIYGSSAFAISNDYVNIIREGKSISTFYGYLDDGYDANGYPKYKDLNKDGVINASDKTVIGEPTPDFTYGLNSVMQYKNFEFSFYIQGSQGNDIYCESLSFMNYYNLGAGFNRSSEMLYDHWTPETPNARYPKISRLTYNYVKMSDRFIYDGSYIRLKNVQLAYNIPVDKFGFRRLKQGQVFVSCQNLLTITEYPWFDPDVNTNGGGSSVDQGIDSFSYPTTKNFTVGVKLRF